MNYAIIGFGKMGRAVDEQAGRRGHRRVAIVDPRARGRSVRREITAGGLEGADVAFEFTVPGEARANLEAIASAGVGAISGTTGWAADRALSATFEAAGVGAVVAPNFSVGMTLFYRVVREAARRFGALDLHQPYVVEHHHRGKVDAPSGTALRLAEIVRRADPRRPEVVAGPLDGALPDGAMHVAAVRAGFESGTHRVGFDGEFDVVELRHSARSRTGFALGAVLAAEWLIESGSTGIHGFDAVLDQLVRSGGRR